MDNKLAKYIGKNYKDSIESLQVKQGTSKEGTLYYYLSITFVNGYESKIFPRSDAQFGLANAFDYSDTDKQVSVEFN